ncbi:hypothetical protein [Longitalea arenae]|uniref:hypothetical protein n=1 Tax=Longitalea arenae TaxID=2812558 RepID=UPI0019683B37|nr:hypothetical protein [Longitalea arenae]
MILHHAKDPLQSLVFFGDSLFNVIGRETELLKLYIAITIERPTIMFEIKGRPRKRYYFRAIHWDKTLLVGVQNDNGIWNVSQYFQDPGGLTMLEIFRAGKQLI